MIPKPVVFVHDHRFSRDALGTFYSEGKITDQVLNRYRLISDDLVVISRMKYISCGSGLTAISGKRIRFAPVKGLSWRHIVGVYGLRNLMQLIREVHGSAACILRLPSILGIVVWVIATVLRKPYFVELVGFPTDSLQSHTAKIASVAAWIMDHAVKVAVYRARGVIYVTKKALQCEYPTRGFTASASNVELQCSAATEVGQCSVDAVASFRIGLMGSFSVPYKGIFVAVEALAELNA